MFLWCKVTPVFVGGLLLVPKNAQRERLPNLKAGNNVNSKIKNVFLICFFLVPLDQEGCCSPSLSHLFLLQGYSLESGWLHAPLGKRVHIFFVPIIKKRYRRELLVRLRAKPVLLTLTKCLSRSFVVLLRSRSKRKMIVIQLLAFAVVIERHFHVGSVLLSLL